MGILPRDSPVYLSGDHPGRSPGGRGEPLGGTSWETLRGPPKGMIFQGIPRRMKGLLTYVFNPRFLPQWHCWAADRRLARDW